MDVVVAVLTPVTLNTPLYPEGDIPDMYTVLFVVKECAADKAYLTVPAAGTPGNTPTIDCASVVPEYIEPPTFRFP